MFGKKIEVTIQPVFPEIDVSGCQECPAIEWCAGYAAAQALRDFETDLAGIAEMMGSARHADTAVATARFLTGNGSNLDDRVRLLGGVIEDCPGAVEVAHSDIGSLPDQERPIEVANPVFK